MTATADVGTNAVEPEPVPRVIHVDRTRGDRVFRGVSSAAGITIGVVLFLIGLFLFIQAIPALRTMGWRFFTTSEWTDAAFGVAAVLYWTVVIAVISLSIALPLAIGTALCITEYAPPRLRATLTSLVDLLAAVPSLVYGLWGFFYLQPKLIPVAEWLSETFGFIPFFNVQMAQFSSSAFIAGVVVSLMVLPIIASVTREVFSRTPPGEKEAALALGSSRWDMIRTVVLPFGRGGIIGGAMLGLGRALGETIAVAMIISPIFKIRLGFLELGANSIASLIALRFGEAASNETRLSALMAAGAVLFSVTLLVNVIASWIVSRSRSAKGLEA